MKVFISGGAKSGKSHYAQDLAVVLSGEGKRYYVATMIPSGWEDMERIRLHMLDREGMGFETLECYRDIQQLLYRANSRGTFLVDSVTSLLQNALFPAEKNYEMDLDAARQVADDLIAFSKWVENVIFVSDYIYSDARRYSESTEQYCKCLAQIDRRLAQACDTVLEVSAGQIIVHKGGLGK